MKSQSLTLSASASPHSRSNENQYQTAFHQHCQHHSNVVLIVYKGKLLPTEYARELHEEASLLKGTHGRGKQSGNKHVCMLCCCLW
jgi:hypothetical protein